MSVAYTFVTLRYLHDGVSGEFANVGVVLHCPARQYLAARLSPSYERLNAIFLKIDHAHYRGLIRHLTGRLDELGEQLRGELPLAGTATLEELCHRVLPPDDSSLQWSPPGAGLAEEPQLDRTLSELYARLVERYTRPGDTGGFGEEDILRAFRARLGPAVAHLHSHRITTPDYHYDFAHAWKPKAGPWQLFEPVSFDLVDPASLLEKANRWLGRGVALRESRDKHRLHFLLGAPRRPGHVHAFQNAKHLLAKVPGQPRLVEEAALEEFADELAATMAVGGD